MDSAIPEKTKKETVIESHINDNIIKFQEEWKQLYLPNYIDINKYEKYLSIIQHFLSNDMLCKDVIGLIVSNIYIISIMTCQICEIKSDSILNSKPCLKCFFVEKREKLKNKYCNNCNHMYTYSVCHSCDSSTSTSDDDWYQSNYNYNFSSTSDDDSY